MLQMRMDWKTLSMYYMLLYLKEDNCVVADAVVPINALVNECVLHF